MSAQPCGCDPDHKNGPYYCERHVPLDQILQEGGTYIVEDVNVTEIEPDDTFDFNGVQLPKAGPKHPELPDDPKERKKIPIVGGVLEYFPDAIAAVARVSYAGNQQHNPGQPLHWAREKSTDHAECIGRHLLQHGSVDTDRMLHTAKLAWRALALLQLEIEAARKRAA